MSVERRWHEQENVIEAVCHSWEPNDPDDGFVRDDVRAALAAAVRAEPVIPVRVVREFADRMWSIGDVGPAVEQALAALLGEYEKGNDER